MSSLRSMLARLARLEEQHAPPPPSLRVLRVFVERDGIARRAIERTTTGARELGPEELATIGLPRRVAPGWPRNAA